jgi:hypothetical protein
MWAATHNQKASPILAIMPWSLVLTGAEFDIRIYIIG